MYNIFLKKERLDFNNFHNQIINNTTSKLYDNFNKVEEQTSIKKRFIPSVMITIGIYLVMIFIGVKLFKSHQLDLETDVFFAIQFILVFAFAFLIYPLIHEILHALAYPKKNIKTIWRLGQGLYLTYCNARLKKQRFLWMLISPLVFLSFGQFLLLLVLNQFINNALLFSIYLEILYVVFTCISDIGAFYIVMKYVPSGAEVFMYGGELYYRQ